jgi:hypothetical protein
MFKKFTSFSNLTLLVALSLSSVAAWYSIIGLTAIFAGAVIPVIIMGSILEIGKITTTVWLRKYWHRASWVLKLYLVPAVIALALLTSMGIFGFLSKAHMDSGITSGDVTAKVALLDEKIKTQRDNIDVARKALQQMDAQVDARLDRGGTEQGAERAVQIRRQQAGERAKLQKEIGDAQKVIQTLNEERAPIASELRKVEAEVGPIKYIAALIYGDDADNNMLESAVRWMIILLVVVFDPLAIALVLAANASKEWDKEEPEETKDEPEKEVEDFFINSKLIARGLDADEEARLVAEANEKLAEIEKEVPEVILPKEPMKFVDAGEHPKDFDEYEASEPIIVEEDPSIECLKCNTILVDAPGIGLVCPNINCDVPNEPETVAIVEPVIESEIITDNVTKEKKKPYEEHGDYVTYEGKHMHRDVLKNMKPELFMLTADSTNNITTSFGTDFPKTANKGDIRVRVDVLPNKVYKFDGRKWIEINKEQSDSYLYDQEYIKFLIERIELGEYDIDLLSDAEKQQVEDYLNSQKS